MRQSLAGYVGLAVLVCTLLAACGLLQSGEEVTDAAVTEAAATAHSTATRTMVPPTRVTPTTAKVPQSATTPASGTTQGREEACRHIGPSQLEQMLEQKDFLLVNTHEPYGYEIDGTDSHVPVDEEGRWLSRYPDDKTAKIVLYCRSGNWSTVAAERLVAAGYTNLWHLDGGMVAWRAAGFPLVAN